MSLAAVGGRYWHRAQSPGIAAAPGIQAAVQHQTAADKITDVEIQEILRPLPSAEHQFGTTGGVGIILDIDRQIAQIGDFALDVAVPPGVHFGLWCPDELRPVPELERHGDAKTADPVAQAKRQGAGQIGQCLFDKGHHGVGHRIAIGLAARPDNRPQKIDQHQIDRPPADLQPEKERTLRHQPHRHRGLADPAAHRFAAHQQPVGFQPADNHRNRLRRQAGQPGNIRFRQRIVPPYDAQHQPLIVGAHAALVGAAQGCGVKRNPLSRAVLIGCHESP